MHTYYKRIGVLVTAVFAGVGCSDSLTDPAPGESEVPWDLLSGTIVAVNSELGRIYLLDAEDRSVRTVASGFGFNALSLRADRRAVAFSSVELDRGGWDIRLVEIVEGIAECESTLRCGEPLVSTEEWEYGPSWSDTGHLAYTATRRRPDGTLHTGIYVDGRLAHADSLSSEGYQRPAWAPDGSILAELVSLGPAGRRGVWRIDPETGSASLLFESRGLSLAVSPDGASLAYGEDLTHIWVSGIAGDDARVIAEGEEVLAWSPDGTHVLYRRHPSGSPSELYLAPVAGGDPILVLPGVSWADWR